ncbi:hypothetical protein CVT25_007562 [Psilocybe cyanescens]|uniref:Uncharacterized protein n=1 Tax=Psilocybe cyanescens TaxID=93625 RepID=A0A409WVT2_PSICY|nr:hypothetical protein CVT25_007562 [Psilocybe cyanescens]
MPSTDPEILAAKIAHRNAKRRETRTHTPSQANLILVNEADLSCIQLPILANEAGPSRIQLPTPTNPQTLSQILRTTPITTPQ